MEPGGPCRKRDGMPTVASQQYNGGPLSRGRAIPNRKDIGHSAGLISRVRAAQLDGRFHHTERLDCNGLRRSVSKIDALDGSRSVPPMVHVPRRDVSLLFVLGAPIRAARPI